MASKFALIIANTEYQDASFAKLTAPGKDAEEFGRVLDSPEIGAFDDVTILFNETASKVSETIDYFFSSRKPDDLLLLYFSGHGVRDEYGSLYLAIKNTNRFRLRSTAIKSDFIREAMDQSRSKRQVLILDCCNSGAFAQGTKAVTGGSIGTAKAFEGTGYGRIVLTASDSTQFAWEGEKVIGEGASSSLFTHFLVKGFEGEADLDGDGKITVDELYDYGYEQVVSRTPMQTPGKWSYKQQGEIILRDNLRPRDVNYVFLPPELLDVSPVPLPSKLLEMLFDLNSGARREGIQELLGLLNGNNLGLARSAHEKLREIAENDDSLNLRKTAGDILLAGRTISKLPIETQKEKLSVVTPAPVEISKKEHVEEKPALKTAGKIEEPSHIAPLAAKDRSQRIERVEAVSEKVPHRLLEWKRLVSNSNFRFISSVAGGFLVISLLVWGSLKFLGNLPATISEPTQTVQTNVTFTSQSSITITSQPAKTSTPSSTKTPVAPTPTVEFGMGSTIQGKDEMTLLYVPAGEFTMGNDEGHDPGHSVYLDTFWIDQTEVTNKQYAMCVSEGKCKLPLKTSSKTHSSYFGNSEFGNYPITYVDWDRANAYCSWAGRRLPTEAEWEKAARGTDGRIFPWGDKHDCSYANFADLPSDIPCVGDTTEVGSYLSGRSFYGAYDMSGNVWEWVNDYYYVDYYATSPSSNPQGPEKGTSHVIRGGAWSTAVYLARSIFRERYQPWYKDYYNIGFRCAMDATP